jgi:excisionase family DNA binding protein
MTEIDAAAVFRRAEHRLRAVLLGDGMDLMGLVRGEERREEVTRELRRMHQAFEAALQAGEPEVEAEPRIAELEEELRRIAASRTRGDALLTVDEVAERLRISKSSVYRRIESGELPAVRLGTHARAPLRVDAHELGRWLRATPVSTPPPSV